jgi:hypothetical protein
MPKLLTLAVLLSIMANPLVLFAAESSTFTVGFTVTSTTTPGTTTGTTGTTGTSGGNGGPSENLPPKITNVSAVPDVHTANITFETEPHSVSIVRFGKTIDYEAGVVTNTSFVKNHSLTLTGLEADTTYYFSITATTGFGKTATLDGLTFRTNEEGVIVPPTIPANPTTFSATAKTDHIQLQWKVPTRPNAEVRIMRSETFFPNDPMDGTLVYQGKASASNDKNVAPGKTYYYTLFVKEGDAYSSGIVAKATMPSVGTEPLPETTQPFENLPTSTTVDPKIKALTLENFLFVQDNRVLPIVDGKVNIDGSKNLSVILSYDKVPEILKTIGITLNDPQDPKKTFSFLLRINNEKTAYVATIGPLGRSGIYNLSITILDYKNQGLKVLRGALRAEAGSVLPIFQGTLRGTTTILNCAPFYLAFVLFLILLVAVFRRPKEGGVLNPILR